ncbi:MAG: hypothetical protein RLZZ249_123 [Actinomycetota bacterium]
MRFPLVTERLSISPLQLADLDSFVSYRQDPQVARYQSWEPSYSIEQGRELIGSQAGIDFPGVGQWLQLGVRESQSERLVGDLALHTLENAGEFEIGYTFATAEQGKGYAYESATRLIRFLFEEVNATKVIATPDSRNAKSIALLRKLGFVQETSKSWVEEFKGETVTVQFFELQRPKTD